MSYDVIGIALEGAELESRISERYIDEYLTEGVVDFAKEKSSAVAKVIKRLYEKVIEVIDDVILNVLSFKDKAMLGSVRKKIKDLKYRDGEYEKTPVVKQKGIDVTKVKNLNYALNRNISNDISEYINEIINNYEDLAKRSGADYETTVSNIISDIFEIKSEKGLVLTNIYDVLKKSVQYETDETEISNQEFMNIKQFVLSDSTSGAVGILDNCRKLKINVKKIYNHILKDIAKDIKEIDDKDSRTEIKKKNKNILKSIFEIVCVSITSTMKITKESIEYCRKVVAAVSAANAKIKKPAGESTSIIDEFDEILKEQGIL